MENKKTQAQEDFEFEASHYVEGALQDIPESEWHSRDLVGCVYGLLEMQGITLTGEKITWLENLIKGYIGN